MNDEQAVVVRIAALRELAALSLEKARRSGEDAREHMEDARGALRRALELEQEAA
jgi:hypothetical protein